MINYIQRGQLGNTLVLHDFKKNPIKLKEWFYYIDSLFSKHNLIPNKMDITGDDNIRIKGKSTIKFLNGKKRLEEKNFQGVDGLWIAALPANVGTEMFDFIYVADLSYSNPRGTCVLCWDDQIAPFHQQYLENLAKELFSYLDPAYGYGYQREFRYGPSFYPFGALAGDDLPREEERRISKWAHVYGSPDTNYHTGMLRDIYPINFLSQKHLDIEIEGQKLHNWIQSKSRRGELNKLNPSFWSWWIPQEDIEKIRQSLIPTNLLIAYR